MNKIFVRFLSLIMLFGIISCEDDMNVPSEDVDGNDIFVGAHRAIAIPVGLHEFPDSLFTCYMTAPDGSTIKREGEIVYVDTVPTILMETGLKDGTYSLLYLEYEHGEPFNKKSPTAHYGLGCSVKIENGRSLVLNNYNSEMNMYGSGTDEDPFIISSYSHLLNLTFAIEDGNELAAKAVYRQVADIDMDYASYRSDSNFGWMPIGTASNPFRGTYIGASTDGTVHSIKNLWAKTRDMNGVGFFGYLLDAKIESLNIVGAEIKGDAAVGVVAGCVLQSGDKRTSSTINNCNVSSSVVSGYTELGERNTMMMGGILGCLDMNAMAMINSCKVDDTTITATINAGGIVGGTGLYTNLSINECQTTSTCSVISDYSGAGGMVGSCDTIQVISCENNATIVGARRFNPSESGTAGIGVGGLVGGSTVSYITSSINRGSVSGYTGVGGIIGSTRAAGAGTESDPMMFNNTYLRYCGNEGSVSGNNNVGGLCGEAQFGCYGGYNTGNVSGKGDYISGGVGNTSLAVVHNTVNSGNISGNNFVSGLVSKTEFGSVAFSHNYGSVTGNGNSSYIGGVCGLATNYSVFHHSGNFGKVTGYDKIGGIVGELGNTDDISGLNIASTVMIVADMTSSLFVGPIIGCVIDATVGVAKRVAQAVSVGVTVVLAGIDSGLTIYPWAAHYDEQEWDQLMTDLSKTTNDKIAEINKKIAELRGNGNAVIYEGISNATLKSNYVDAINSQLEYYTTGSNDSIINANINNKRDNLANDVSNSVKVTNIVHTALSAVAIAATTVASIASAFATGGTSLVFTAVGMGTTIFGCGVSTSSMICETEENAVIVSQCVNAGDVVAKDKNNLYYVGGLVGHLGDHGRVYDCLNTAGVRGGHFVGTAESKSEISRCLSIWKNSDPVSDTANLIYRSWGKYSDVLILDDRTYISGDDSGTISKEDLKNSAAYPWAIGASEKWNIPDGAEFAIPFKSEMRND